MNLSFFLEMCWKSSLIAGVALLLALLLKSRSPADRALVLEVALGLLVLLPLISLFLPAWQVEVAAEQTQPLVGSLIHYAPAPVAAVAASTKIQPFAPVETSIFNDPSLLIVIFYFGGLLFAAGRLLGGLSTLRRWTANADRVSCPRWIHALKRVSAASGGYWVELRISDEVKAPLSWGWRAPVILIDAEAYKRAEDADAILAHEMAHIVRRDWPALMLSRVAAVLFWFNPLVWLLGRAFIRHAEEAADTQALAQVEPAHYAQALLGCASHVSRSPLLANSIASSDLARRVQSVLDGRGRSIPSGSKLCAATILGCIALAGPVSAMKLIPGASAKAAAARAPMVPPPPAPVEGIAAPAPVRTAALPAPSAPASKAAIKAPAPLKAAAEAKDTAALEKASATGLAFLQTAPVAPATAEMRYAKFPIVLVAAEVEAPGLRLHRSGHEAAIREAREAGAEAARAGGRAARAAEIASHHARRSMAAGVISMEKGAESMKRGARHMAEEAVKLRDPVYREQQIARQAARGQRITHQELVDAIPQLEKGSRDMIKGAEDMRRAAEQMRLNQHN